MTLKTDKKPEGRLTCASQNWDFDGILLSKVENI